MIAIDMEMPRNCNECRFHVQGTFCYASPDRFPCACISTTTGKVDTWRPNRCPLHEVHFNDGIGLGGDCSFYTNGDGR